LRSLAEGQRTPEPPRGSDEDAGASPARQEDAVLPTPYPDLNAVLCELTDGIQAVLGHTFVGGYLQGSFAAGGFDRHSDVDFIIVTEHGMPNDQVQALQTVHERIYDLDCEWAQHLEGSYFPRGVLRSCDERGRPLWYLEHGSRSLVLSEHCNSAVVRWVVREHGVVLVGPAPAGLVDPIPVETLRNEILATIRDWGHDILAHPERFNSRFYQSFVVLSYCRMLQSLRTGRVESKRAGAEWAKAALDPSWAGLIDRTWDGRPNPSLSVRQPADPGDFRSTLKFVQYAIEASARLAPGVKTGGVEGEQG
jgi:hypothetical protein